MSHTLMKKTESIVAKVEDARKLTRRRLLKHSLLGLASLAAIDGYLIEPRWLRFETLEVPIHGLSAAFDGYRIALLTDFHYPRWISGDYIRKAIAVASAFQPDLMAFTGDFFDLPHAPQVPEVTGFYDQAQARDGV